jgi:trehalose/maltose hydrolase-like predicted phosphorylase
MATKTEKTVNYTDEQTTELVAAYTAVVGESREVRDTVVAEFATKFGKTVRSITAKLSREKVYVAKEYVTKTGETVQKKDEWADAIGKVIPSLTESELESLTKANKTALKKIFETLANSKPLE